METIVGKLRGERDEASEKLRADSEEELRTKSAPCNVAIIGVAIAIPVSHRGTTCFRVLSWESNQNIASCRKRNEAHHIMAR